MAHVFDFISAEMEVVRVELSRGMMEQCLFLQAAADVEEHVGCVPVATATTIHAFVAFLRHVEERCRGGCSGLSVGGASAPAWPFNRLYGPKRKRAPAMRCEHATELRAEHMHTTQPQNSIPPRISDEEADDAFLLNHIALATTPAGALSPSPSSSSTTPHAMNASHQRLLLELIVLANFMGHARLSHACARCLAHWLMRSTESDIIASFGPAALPALAVLGEETMVEPAPTPLTNLNDGTDATPFTRHSGYVSFAMCVEDDWQPRFRRAQTK